MKRGYNCRTKIGRTIPFHVLHLSVVNELLKPFEDIFLSVAKLAVSNQSSEQRRNYNHLNSSFRHGRPVMHRALPLGVASRRALNLRPISPSRAGVSYGSNLRKRRRCGVPNAVRSSAKVKWGTAVDPDYFLSFIGPSLN
jgi:hypothetical protein